MIAHYKKQAIWGVWGIVSVKITTPDWQLYRENMKFRRGR